MQNDKSMKISQPSELTKAISRQKEMAFCIGKPLHFMQVFVSLSD